MNNSSINKVINKTLKKLPRITIITVVFNGKTLLEKTIHSVISQQYKNIEYIIIDGGSTDGTQDIIKRYERKISYWVSEPDNGISDAFNKGISASKGDYILMLNAGDVFSNDTVLADNIHLFDESDIIVFRAFVQNTGRFIGINSFEGKTQAQKARLPHQATFVNRGVYNRYGLYDTSYRIRMDYEFFLRCNGKLTANFSLETLVFYDNSGLSGQLKHRLRYEQEAIQAECIHLKKLWYYKYIMLFKPYVMTALSWLKRRINSKRNHFKKKRVLVFHSWGLGDTIMLTPALQMISTHHEVSVLTTTAINVKLLQPISALEEIHYKKNFFALALFCLTHYGKYQVIAASAGINQNKMKILQMLIGAKQLLIPELQKDVHRITTNIKAFQTLLGQEQPVAPAVIPTFNQYPSQLLSNNKKNIGFSIGSKLSQAYKRWDINNFIALANQFNNSNTLFFIGPEEHQEKKCLIDANMHVVELPLNDLISVISRLDILIGNDNGLMHIGYAANITTYTIFGMTNPKEIGGYSKNNYSISLHLNCQPCLDSQTNNMCQSLTCLNTLTPTYVAKQITLNEGVS